MLIEEEWLLAVLRNEAYWPIADAECVSTERILQAASRHGLIPLVTDKLCPGPIWNRLPEDLQHTMLRRTWAATAHEVGFQQDIRGDLAALSADGLESLFLKGTGLAYTLYAAPELRTRCDADLLLRDRGSAERAWTLLESRGFQRGMAISGNYVSHQYSCSRTGGSCANLVLDIHWKLSNSNFFARKFSFDELWQERVALSGLGEHAYTLSPVHALILALFHRIGHLGEGQPERLIWLYDIDLLCRHLNEKQWTRFADLVCDRGLGALCADGLNETARLYGTPVPTGIADRIGVSDREAARQLVLKRFGLGSKLAELMSLPRWSDRLGLVREHLFPHPDYMRHRYGASGQATLIAAYLRRPVEGVYRYLSGRARINHQPKTTLAR